MTSCNGGVLDAFRIVSGRLCAPIATVNWVTWKVDSHSVHMYVISRTQRELPFSNEVCLLVYYFNKRLGHGTALSQPRTYMSLAII